MALCNLLPVFDVCYVGNVDVEAQTQIERGNLETRPGWNGMGRHKSDSTWQNTWTWTRTWKMKGKKDKNSMKQDRQRETRTISAIGWGVNTGENNQGAGQTMRQWWRAWGWPGARGEQGETGNARQFVTCMFLITWSNYELELISTCNTHVVCFQLAACI